MASAAGEVFKEFHDLARNIDKLTDGQAQVELDDDTGNEAGDSITFLLRVCPNTGPYEGATIKFRICVTSEYPADAPGVECLNKVYHPNIDVSECGQPSSICVNMLGEDWQPEVGLDGCVNAILFLFHHPNQDDALSHVFSGISMEEEDFESNVRASIRGEEVNGHFYDTLLNEICPTDNKNENLDGEGSVSPAVTSAQCLNVDATESAQNAQGADSFASANTDVHAENAFANTNSDQLINSEMPTNTTMSESEETGLQAPKAGQNEKSKEDEVLIFPLDVSKILIKETQPWEIHSYNWRNVAFSLCHLLKWLYHRLQKKIGTCGGV